MKAQSKRCLSLLDRIERFLAEHHAVTLGVRGLWLRDRLTTISGSMRALAANQVAGFGKFRGGVSTRRTLAAELRAQMREIELVAEAMDPLLAPVSLHRLQTPRSKSFPGLIIAARAFVEALTPTTVQAAFLERDFPADFVTSLSSLADAMQEAGGRKNAGRQLQSGGTLGLQHAEIEALTLVKELKAIVSRKLRRTDPALLGVWKAASRLERAPRRSKAVETPIDSSEAAQSAANPPLEAANAAETAESAPVTTTAAAIPLPYANSDRPGDPLSTQPEANSNLISEPLNLSPSHPGVEIRPPRPPRPPRP